MNGALHTLPPLEAGTRALVLGLGRTGLSCARYLRRKGLEVRVADTRSMPPGAAALREQVPDAELCVGAFASSLLDGVAQVLISPGLSLREPIAAEAARRGLPVVGDIELFAREASAPVAAITGTNGKSTVTALLAEVANAAGRTTVAGGNLGEPALDLSDAALACVSAGPYLERPQAQQAEARLARLGFAVRLRASRESVRTGDWVRVEDLATPEDAANALAQLKAAGIADAYVLAEEAPGTVISLGVFTESERAEQARVIARMAGFEPRTVERTREAGVFWLDIDRQASAGLPSLEQLGADVAGQLPAIGLRRCPAPEPAAEQAAAPAQPIP